MLKFLYRNIGSVLESECCSMWNLMFFLA